MSELATVLAAGSSNQNQHVANRLIEVEVENDVQSFEIDEPLTVVHRSPGMVGIPDKETRLANELHDPVTLPPGEWKSGGVRTVDPVSKATMNAFD